MIRLSVAIAIYNVKPYLRLCLDSICDQLADDVELLLIDDGSTDGSGAICDAYAARDSRIRVIHQANAGLSEVRNVSIREARGTWVIFGDGDDTFTDDAIEIMRSYADEEENLIVFSAARFTDQFCPEAEAASGTESRLSEEDIQDYRREVLNHTYQNHGFFYSTAWAKMWRVDYVRNSGIWFQKGLTTSQDAQYIFAITRNIRRMRVVNRCVYGYRTNPGAISLRFSDDAADYYHRLFDSFQNDMKEHGELDSGVLFEAFQRRAINCLTFTLIRSIMHPDCPWGHRKRASWLRKLCDEAWVQETIGYAAQLNALTTPFQLAGERRYTLLEWYCCRSRMRRRIERWLNQSSVGRGFTKWYGENRRKVKRILSSQK